MSVQQQCLSCEHLNPAEAKFCQECGSALNLKLCKQCEAINEAKAERCHKCDTDFVPPAKPAAAPLATRKASKGRVAAALGVAVVIVGAVAVYVAPRSKPPAPTAVVAVKPPAAQIVPVAMPSSPAPVAAERVEKVEKAAKPKESAAARPAGVTHTRAAAPAPRPAAARAPVARTVATEAPVVNQPAPSTPVPVTHTKRAVETTPTKSETQ